MDQLLSRTATPADARPGDWPPDPADISLDWLGRYEWLVVRGAARYLPMLPGGREDLLQECRIALLNAAEKFDPTLGFPFASYAATAIGHAARRYLSAELRRGGRGKAGDSEHPHPRVVTVAPDSGGRPLLDRVPDESRRPLLWDAAQWERVFGCLTATQQRVVRLRVFDNLSYREVGAALGFRESRASFVYQQAIRRLRADGRALDAE